jgi:hypothetical protein
MTATILVITLAAVLAWICWHIVFAPEGWEDESGWHEGREPEDDDDE